MGRNAKSNCQRDGQSASIARNGWRKSVRTFSHLGRQNTSMVPNLALFDLITGQNLLSAFSLLELDVLRQLFPRRPTFCLLIDEKGPVLARCTTEHLLLPCSASLRVEGGDLGGTKVGGRTEGIERGSFGIVSGGVVAVGCERVELRERVTGNKAARGKDVVRKCR